jgi:Flp pilus assembly protein TadG
MMRRTGRLRKRRGGAVVEFAIVVPVLLLILVGIAEFGMIGSHKMALAQAARAGTREASIGGNLGTVCGIVRGAAGVQINDDQIAVEYNDTRDGSGEWWAATDSDDGRANAVPSGYLVRVRIVNWQHPMVSGAFFDWLPGVADGQFPLNAQMVMRRE